MKKLIGLILICTIVSSCATSTKINISTNVPAATVVIDGKMLGETPLTSVELKNKSGSYHITIEKEGYKTYNGLLWKEFKKGPMTAVITGYFLCLLVLPMLLWLYLPYTEGPMEDHHFLLEEEGA